MAVNWRSKRDPPPRVWLGTGAKTGATLISRAAMRISLVEASGGIPPSTTRTRTRVVAGASRSVGVQLRRPPGVRVSPAGAFRRLKTIGPCGRSTSATLNCRFRVDPSSTDWFDTAANTGTPLLISPTTTTNWLVELSGGVPLSVTRTRTVPVEGPWASVGVHASCPDALTVIPAGPSTRLKVSRSPGRSMSEALRVTAKGKPSLTD